MHSSKMGVYVRTDVMQSGRPVYKKSSSGTRYLYFWEANGEWQIGSSYTSDYRWIKSAGAGADASCPVDAPTWKEWDGSVWLSADGITVVAQEQLRQNTSLEEPPSQKHENSTQNATQHSEEHGA